MRILIFGATGMLGSAVAEVLAAEPDFQLTLSSRTEGVRFDIDSDLARLGALIEGHDWIVNAAGITKPKVAGDNALRINAQFPRRLAQAAEAAGARVIQIATDGVFSGTRGTYTEDDPHDAEDDYGKSKSLGEIDSPAMTHLRCSIIGPEPRGESNYLLEWLRRQPASATVQGFTNHWWNGITTLHFARIVAGICRGACTPPRLQHVIPADAVTKADLLRELARHYGRNDLRIENVEAAVPVDRTLATRNPEINAALWSAGGYSAPPTIREMLAELTSRLHDTSG